MWGQVGKWAAMTIGAGASMAVYHKRKSDGPVVHASWTINDDVVSPCAQWNSNWDYRDPKSLVKPMKNKSPEEENRYNAELEKVRSKFSHHIVLIRHGEYMEKGDDDDDNHLTERGKLQSKYTGQRLKDYNIRWSEIIASTMTRAQETCAVILKELDTDIGDAKKCVYIREGAPIPPQPPVGHWRVPSSFYRDGARIEAGFRRLFYRSCPEDLEDRYSLVVCHANVIRYFVCRALQLPPEAWLRFNLNHGSITWISISPSGNVSLRFLGDTGYMPTNMLTNRAVREKKKKE